MKNARRKKNKNVLQYIDNSNGFGCFLFFLNDNVQVAIKRIYSSKSTNSISDTKRAQPLLCLCRFCFFFHFHFIALHYVHVCLQCMVNCCQHVSFTVIVSNLRIIPFEYVCIFFLHFFFSIFVFVRAFFFCVSFLFLAILLFFFFLPMKCVRKWRCCIW